MRDANAVIGTISRTDKYAMQKAFFISTDLFDEHIRNEAWQAVTRPIFETTLQANVDGAALEGSLMSQPVGSLLIGPTTFNQQQYRRDRRTIAQGGLDHYLVQLFVSGTLAGDCDGRVISAGPGDICVFDLSRTFSSNVSTGSTISLMLPRDRLDKAAGGRSLHGKVLSCDMPITRLLADFVLSLSGVAADLDAANAIAVEESMLQLLGTGIARNTLNQTPADTALAQVLRRSILDFIDANLFEHALDAACLMRRFRISRAHLYRMFAAYGGVATIVRNKRLDVSYRRLTSPMTTASSLTEIAFDLGFSSSGQFSRAFRARYSVTPSDVRKNSGQPPEDFGLADLQAHFASHSVHPETDEVSV